MAASDGISFMLGFDEHPPLAALDLSSFIFDLNRIYVSAYRQLADGVASPRPFRGYGRNSYRLPEAVRLNVQRIRFESPGLIELATNAGYTVQIISIPAAVIGAAWALTQIIEKLTLLPYDREKAQLEIEKLRIEVDRMLGQDRSATLLHSQEAQSAIRQLESNPLKPSSFDIRVTLADRF